MKGVFVYGSAVEGDNFTDREAETKRLKANFEHGINTLLISDRRIGKTSLVRRVKNLVNKKIAVVYMDIFDCRSEYDFYNKLATAVLQQTANRTDIFFQNVKNFLGRLSPRINISPDPSTDFSISLGITPKEYAPEQQILQLAESVAKKMGKHIVVCIDEFQQIGEFPDSVAVQKRLRSVWQLQQNVSYCLFGSKKHLLTHIFQNKSMPFYQFGDAIYLGVIPTKKWVPFICNKFKKQKLQISESLAARICTEVENYSSYVQQLAWNVMLDTDSKVTDEIIDVAVVELIAQNSALFMQQTEGLSSYQMNMLRALANDVHDGFTSKEVLENYRLGTKSNVARIKKVLIDRDLVQQRETGLYISDPLFKKWFRNFCM